MSKSALPWQRNRVFKLMKFSKWSISYLDSGTTGGSGCGTFLSCPDEACSTLIGLFGFEFEDGGLFAAVDLWGNCTPALWKITSQHLAFV